MKTILKSALAALMLSSINLTAAAANSNPSAVDALIEKVGNEILPEVIAEAQASGKKPTKEALAKKFMAKLRQHPEELKTAFIDECTSKEGKDKKRSLQMCRRKNGYGSQSCTDGKRNWQPECGPLGRKSQIGRKEQSGRNCLRIEQSAGKKQITRFAAVSPCTVLRNHCRNSATMETAARSMGKEN